MKNIVFLIATFFSVFSFYAQVSVSTVAEFESELADASAGDVITVLDGVYTNADLDIDVDATSANPVVIQAANPGAVFLEGNSRIEISGSYITFKGFIFQNPNGLGDGVSSGGDIDPVIRLNKCDYCIVENVKIDNYNASESPDDELSFNATFKWLLLDGQFNEVRYCSFLGKNGVGSIINDNRNTAEEDFLKIHHNYFADRVPVLGEVNVKNDQDAIRLGNSGTSLDDSSSEVFENYFYNFVGEVEMISNKAGNNKYYNNTFRDYEGSLTLRHGDGCEVYGNFFFAEGNGFTAGIRVVGEDHKIYNNYIQDINSRKTNSDGSTSGSNATGAINISNGVVDSPLNRYFQVKNTYIVHNTIVNCDLGIRVGTAFDTDEQTLPPENLVIADNIIMNATNNGFQLTSEPVGANSINEGNLNFNGDWDLEEGENGNQTVNSPLLTLGADFYELTSGSSAVGAALGEYDFVSIDVFDGARADIFDVGAEEFGANKIRMPFTSEDVGQTIGFGAIAVNEPTLIVNPTALSTGKEATTLLFNISSNVDWTIVENFDWLSLSTTSGSDSETIIVTVDANGTEEDRSAVIAINEVSGGSDLTGSIVVTQTTNFTATEIEIVGFEAVGTQENEDGTFPNPPENSFNDDPSNYWTGNAFIEDEVHITFDLECIHELSEIGINFWKADERTTTFSIAIANQQSGPFTTIIDSRISDGGSGVTVDTEQIFDISGNNARFLRFIGLGNSSGSGWSSIANVNIYGNVACEEESTLSNDDFGSLANKGVTLFPVPVTNGELTIVSPKYEVDGVKVYNMAGAEVISANANNENTTQVDVSNLTVGIYFIVLENIGVAKFIVE